MHLICHIDDNFKRLTLASLWNSEPPLCQIMWQPGLALGCHIMWQPGSTPLCNIMWQSGSTLGYHIKWQPASSCRKWPHAFWSVYDYTPNISFTTDIFLHFRVQVLYIKYRLLGYLGVNKIGHIIKYTQGNIRQDVCLQTRNIKMTWFSLVV